MRIGIVGAGAMGAGIALVAASAGEDVVVFDAFSGAAERGVSHLKDSLAKQVGKGRMTPEAAAEIVSRLSCVGRLEDLRSCGLIVEAIIEDLEAKVALFAALDEIVADDATLATNTSSLSIDAIASRTRLPGRVAGMHFFNPPPVMKLVEVVSGNLTDSAVADALFDLARAWGKSPVHCASTPGFIVNRVARPFYGEALRILEARACAPEIVDTVVRGAGGFRMGPLELMDFIGHDVNFAVTTSVYNAFFQDPRYRPSLVQKALVDAGRLGRKTGAGFYRYEADQAPTRATAPSWVGTLGPVLVHLDAVSALARDLRASDLEVVETSDGPDILISGVAVVETDGRPAFEREREIGQPVIVVDWVLPSAKATARAAAASPGVAEAELNSVGALFSTLGQTLHFIADVPGLIMARTLAMLTNEALEALAQGVASAGDIDLAMMGGANYPLGPIAWGEVFGAKRVLAVLEALGRDSPDGRYRPASVLRKAAAGIFEPAAH